MKIYDVIIVGGGPAGMNAAVVLGRCKRSVLLFDAGTPRNKNSRGVHNYITRDGTLPADFIAIAKREIKKYSVALLTSEITKAQKIKNIFLIFDKAGNKYQCKKLLLATGVKDILPAIPGIATYYGRSVFHCPYCDGWEVKDKMIGIYAKHKNGFALAISLKTWSANVTLYTNGRNYLSATERKILDRKKITIVSKKIKSFNGRNGFLKQIVFADGDKRICDAIFFTTGFNQQSDLAQQLGCRLNKKGVYDTNRFEQTSIPGLYIAGDSSKDMQFVVVAAAEGAKAAVNINKELQKEEMMRRE